MILEITRMKQLIRPKIPKTISQIGIFGSMGQLSMCIIPMASMDIGTPMIKISVMIASPLKNHKFFKYLKNKEEVI